MAALLVLLALACAAPAAGEDRPVSPREAEGHRIRLIGFTYPSTRVLRSEELRNAMRLRQGEPFHYRYLRGDLAAVVALYQTRGYREAAVTRKQVLLGPRQDVVLRIELDSGPRWRFSAVRVDGGEPFAPAQLLAHVRVRAGDPVDYAQVLEDERSLQGFLNEQGFAQATVENEWTDAPDSHTTEVVYHVRPGKRMYVGQVTLMGEDSLVTRPSLIRRYLTVKPGDLYDPRELARSRQELARTDLFRSVFFHTPQISSGDSLQPIEVRVQERKYVRLGANAYLSASGDELTPRLSGSVQHRNVLGRGNQVGVDLAWGRPLQGATAYVMERNVLSSGADLILSAGLNEEWGSRMVLADPDDPVQYDLLVTHDTILEYLLLFAGEQVAREYIQAAVYDYTAIERVFELSGALTRRWDEVHEGRVAVNFTRARTWPDPRSDIHYTPGDASGGEGGQAATAAAPPAGAPSGSKLAGALQDDTWVDYSDGTIPVDATWEALLTDRSRSVSLTSEFVRDSRDDRIAPNRGALLRLSGLYAIKLGALSTHIADGEVEVRHYRPLGSRFVFALAGQYTHSASLRSHKPLPQLYWKQYGGDGSLRGVDRAAIAAVGGGRMGINLRTELRYQSGRVGLVGFLDRAGVWRHARDARLADLVRPSGMVDGTGLGLRYSVGFPFRLDVAFNDGFDAARRMRVYFSIGQAF